VNGGPDGVRGGETLGERLSYWEYRSAERVAMALPESVGRRLFSLAGALAFRIAPGARRTVKSNLARVLGRDRDSPLVDAAAREAFRSYARYWYDTFRMRVIPPEEFLKRHGSVGLEHIERALEGGRGALLALPHLGNWDAAGHWLHVLGHSMTAVAEELRPRRVYDLFLEHRRALGIGIVPLTDTRKVGEDLVRPAREVVDAVVLVEIGEQHFTLGPGGDELHLRAERDQASADRALAEVRRIAGTDENLLPAIREALRARCTVGEISGELRELWGTYDAQHA